MRIIYFLGVLMILITCSCENQEWEYKDFDYTACYFPYQTPVRTLILGDYDQGFNENDNSHKFEIGAVLSGVYSNEIERQVHFMVDETLLDHVSNVVALPTAFYEIETASPVTIPVGSTKARILVKLEDDFFNQPLSVVTARDSVNYVIPLLLTEVGSIDTILSGISADGITSPVRTNYSDWEIEPKDYTLFGIKYINEYHGHYLRRGVDVLTDALDNVVSNIYHADYVESDELIRVESTGRNSVILSNRVRRDTLESPGEINFELSFDESQNCTVENTEDSQFVVNGTGKFVQESEQWGGKARNAIYLDYTYQDDINNESHHVMDTLVIRDRDVVFESFIILP